MQSRRNQLIKWSLSGILILALGACGGGNSSSQPTAPVDSDGDGVPDTTDAFPNDATESVDTDGDGVGDNADAFPNDATETADTDSDGVGDNTDNCVDAANADQADADANGSGDACDAMPTAYEYNSSFTAGESSVSYTGQTARQLLMLGMVDALEALTERVGESTDIETELQFFMNGSGANTVNHGFTVGGGETIAPGPTYGDISTGKNLDGKIAGGNGAGGGETQKLIDDEFFGWVEGLDNTPLPIELVNQWISQQAADAGDGTTVTVATVGDPAAAVSNVNINAAGVHYRQLLQKFLSGAVSFSQGTYDYFQSPFADQLNQDGTKDYGEGEHNFDEAFGYFGATRDYGDYNPDQAAGKSDDDRDGYHDTNQDGEIDVRSEVVFGHAQNCAKRDRGSAGAANPTNLMDPVFDAFLAGRRILETATADQTLTTEAAAALQGHITVASKIWEQCIAATVVHYINDVTADMGSFVAPNFADVSNFTDLAKHWGEMKGFALALQFSPASPFRDGTVAGIDLDDLKQVLSLMGDAPVLADGSQGGQAATGTAQAAIDGYLADLAAARDILEEAYGFDAEVVAGW